MTFILLDIIDIYCVCRLLNYSLTFRLPRKTMLPVFSAVYALYVLMQVLSETFSSYPVKPAFLLLCSVFLFFLYSDVFYKKIFWIFFVMLILSQTWVEGFPGTNLSLSPEIILPRILLILPAVYFSRPKYGRENIFSGFYKEISAIIFIDGVYLALLFHLIYKKTLVLNVNTAIALSVFVLILVSALSIYLLYKVAGKSEEIMNNTLKLKQAEMEHKLTSDMASVVENLRSLRHDMNNHMSILQGFLSVGAYEEMEAYLSSLTQELSLANSFYFPENKVLSVLLNSKISKASQLGIEFETEILTSKTPFSERDLCAVIGNVIENAIEASSVHEKPYIYFTMYQDKGQLHIQCENTFVTAPVFKNGRPLTTKEDKTAHGIGTQNICSIVNAYHGTTGFSADERFHTVISLPMEKFNENSDSCVS